MKELVSFLNRELGPLEPETRQNALAKRGLRADLYLHGAEGVWVVQATRSLPGPDDVARLAMMRTLVSMSEKTQTNAVLVVPAASDRIRDLAQQMDVRILLAPMELLPQTLTMKEHVPLTSPASWAVVVELMRTSEVAGIARLAKAAGVSIAWAHRVVAYLESTGAIQRSTGRIRLTDPEQVMGLVAAKRPLESLCVSTVETGHSIQGVLQLLNTQLGGQLRGQEKTLFALCGITAATWHGIDYLEENQMKIYCERPEAVKNLFRSQKGGVTVRVHRPDREIVSSAEQIRGTPCVTRPQALLDVLGEGGRYWDSAQQLLEMIRHG